VVEVAPAPTDEPGTNDLLAGTFLEQIGECLTAIVNLGNEYQAIDQQTTPSAMYQSANQWRSDVWTFLSKHPLTRCELLTAVSSLQALAPPGPQDNVSTYQPTVDAATAPLAATVFEFILECICSALLPPCSGSQTDPRVVLAAVTIKGGDCQIVNICNMARRFVWTWPNFFYWIPIGGIGHALLKLLCCGLSGKLFRESVDNQNFAFDIRKNASAPGAAPGATGASGGAAPDAAAGGAGSSPATGQFLRFAKLISTIPFFRANSERPADPLTFVKTLAPVFAQALVGLAAGQSSSSAAYTAQLGADSRQLPRDLHATPQAVDWPLELWALQLLGGQPTVAYTAGNTVVGFGVQPNEDLRTQVSQLKELVAQHQAILSRLPTPPSP
jgi:hypothetical protein